MKTTNIIQKMGVALLLFMATALFSNAMAQEKTYGFGYAYSHSSKELYITTLVNGLRDSDQYQNASDNSLKVQWHDYFQTIVSKSYNYTVETEGFITADNYEQAHKYRIEIIGKFKQKGFSIHDVTGFSYVNKKR